MATIFDAIFRAFLIRDKFKIFLRTNDTLHMIVLNKILFIANYLQNFSVR